MNKKIIITILLFLAVGGVVFTQSSLRDFNFLVQTTNPNAFQAYEKIFLEEAWQLLDAVQPTTTPVTIGALDTGIEFSHPEFSAFVNFGSSSPSDLFDIESDGHGTSIGGIIGANNLLSHISFPATSSQMNGIVSGVENLNYVFESRNIGIDTILFGTKPNPFDAYFSIKALADKTDVSIINLSLTFPVAKNTIESLFQQHSDILFVVAAGAEDQEENNASAVLAKTLDNVITVSATDLNDRRAMFTTGPANFGDAITLAAPGDSVYIPAIITIGGVRHTTLDGVHEGFYVSDGEGTSLSTAMVTGVAAILKSLKPNLTPAEIKNILITTADPIQTGEPDKRIGTGCYSNPNDPVNTGCRLNAFRAVQHTLTGCIPPPSNLVAWWPGDGHFKDISANEHHAAPFNGATTTPDGFVDGSFLFDGMNDYLAVPHDTAFHPLASSGFSIDTWVNLSSAQPPNQHIIDKSHVFINEWAFQGAGGDIFERGSNRFTNAGEVNWGLAAGPTATETDPFIHVGTIIPVNDNTWHHITATWDGSLMKMYLDGILKETVPFSGPVLSNTFPLHIGFEPVTGARPPSHPTY